ncbi:tetratricopeptide repeat protein [Marivivens niveibacter]|nr:tetratricopeptide repeat protein [Marivivens niveibacter]
MQLDFQSARNIAAQAVRVGDTQVAIDIATQLLRANPDDTEAHAILASSLLKSGDTKAAYRAARLGYRTATENTQHLALARIASIAAFQNGRLTASQLWLRRAAIHAPTPQTEAQIAQDYRRIAQQNPLRLQFDLSFSQSDNVNGGSESEYNIIDGLTAIGTLSPDAQALSGFRVGYAVTAKYRVAQTSDTLFELNGHVDGTSVFLSNEAKEASPDSENSDFSSARVTLGATYRQNIGDVSTSWQFKTGRRFAAGDPYYDFAQYGGGLDWRSDNGFGVGLDASRENRFGRNDSDWSDEVTSYAVSLHKRFSDGPLAGRGRLTFSQSETESSNSNRNGDVRGISMNYSFANRVGPAQITAQLGRSWADYPDYTIIVPVPGGRSDDTTFASIDFTFPDQSFAGFAPVLTVTGQWTESNVSRFDRSASGIEFGLRSTF